jgi:hypothetical protein
MKTFPIYGRIPLQLRAEVFNFTNTPTCGNPAGDIDAGNIGTVTGLAANSGARAFQLALKLCCYAMRILFLALCATSFMALAEVPEVIIYGGTAAAVSAAVQLSRAGHSVAIVAPETHIGDITVEGPGSGDSNNHWFRNDLAVRGLAAEFYQRIGKKHGSTEPVYKYEAHIAEEVFADWIRESRIVVPKVQRPREKTRRPGPLAKGRFRN